MNHIEKDPLQKKIETRNWIALGILLLIGFVLDTKPFEFTLGVFSGGLISIANYYGCYLGLKKAFSQISNKSKSLILIRYYLRFILTGIVLFFLITRIDIGIIGLILGLSVVVINIVITTILEVSKKNFILNAREG